MIKYCKRCEHHIPEMDELKNESETENGLNICGASLSTTTDMIGEKVFKMSGSAEFCHTCGKLQRDARTVIYSKCEIKNQSKKCKDFKPKFWWRIISIFLRKEG